MSDNIPNVVVIDLTGNIAGGNDEDDIGIQRRLQHEEGQENLGILNALGAAAAAVVVDDDFQRRLDEDQARIDADNQRFLQEEFAAVANGDANGREERLAAWIAAAADDRKQQDNVARQEELRMVAEQEECDCIEAQHGQFSVLSQTK